MPKSRKACRANSPCSRVTGFCSDGAGAAAEGFGLADAVGTELGFRSPSTVRHRGDADAANVGVAGPFTKGSSLRLAVEAWRELEIADVCDRSFSGDRTALGRTELGVVHGRGDGRCAARVRSAIMSSSSTRARAFRRSILASRSRQGLGDDASHRLAGGAGDPLRERGGPRRILDVEAHRPRPFSSFTSSSTFLHGPARVVHDLGRDGSRRREGAAPSGLRAAASLENSGASLVKSGRSCLRIVRLRNLTNPAPNGEPRCSVPAIPAVRQRGRRSAFRGSDLRVKFGLRGSRIGRFLYNVHLCPIMQPYRTS